MKFIRYALATLLIAVTAPFVTAQNDNNDLLVDIPVVPENITRLEQRCNYIVDKYWDHANMKSMFSSLNRLDKTFEQFLAFTPYATADTVQMAIDKLIKGVERADARNLDKLGRLAEKWVGSDTCEYASDDMMYMFANGIAQSKKFKGAEKERYAAIAKRLGNCRRGATVADFEFTTTDGTKAHLSDVKSQSYLLFFYEPDCIDCRIARTLLSQNFVLKTLQSHNMLRVIAIYPGEPDGEWSSDLESMPDLWVVGAAPDIDTMFTIDHSPQMYYLDRNYKVDSKGFGVESFLRYLDQFMNTTNNAGQSQGATEAPATAQ